MFIETLSSNIWLANKPINPQAQRRCFAFPCACANATFFRSWLGKVDPFIDFLPIQLPGRGLRFGEPCIENIADLVPALVSALLPFLDKPFTFFGHSLGALIAYECAMLLQEQEMPEPLRLVVAAYHAPQVDRADETYHNLPDDIFKEKLKKLGGMPQEVFENEELMQLILPIGRSDFKLHETYTYLHRYQLNCPIIALGGDEDEYVSKALINRWSELTSNSFKQIIFKGGHHFISEHMDAILEVL